MKYIPILLLNLQLLSATAKDLDLGLLDDIEEAVRSEMPLPQDLNIFVEVGTDGYTTPLELDASALQMNGFEINIYGSVATLKLKSKTVYFDDDLVVESDAETESESKYINAIGPDGIEGRVDISGGTDLVYYYIKDHLGSITGTIFEEQLLEAKFYYAYGNTDKLSVAAEKTKEGFTGKEFDEEGNIETVTEGINLHYFGARYYDSDVGLWISPDAERQFNTPYAYSPNPTNDTDPDGNCSAPKVDKGQVGVCIEAFIAADYIKWGGRGDNRTFSATDKSLTARVKLYYSWDSKKGLKRLEPVVERSGFLIKGMGFKGFLSQNEHELGEGHYIIEFSAKNGELHHLGKPMVPKFLEEPIDAQFSLKVGPNGIEQIGGVHDAYPSYGIYSYGDDGKPIGQQYQFPETTIEKLAPPYDVQVKVP